jgi:hypothetical protein
VDQKRNLNNREAVFSAWSVPRDYKGTKKVDWGIVVENWIEFWRWQSKLIEKWQEMNWTVERRLHV